MRTGALCLLLPPLAQALGQEPILDFTGARSEDTFRLAGSDQSAGQILVSSNDYWGVIRAAGDLAIDFGRVTGTNFTLSNGEDDAEPAVFEFEPVDVRNNTAVSMVLCCVLKRLLIDDCVSVLYKQHSDFLRPCILGT